jgi:hypothetical protein
MAKAQAALPVDITLGLPVIAVLAVKVAPVVLMVSTASFLGLMETAKAETTAAAAAVRALVHRRTTRTTISSVAAQAAFA